MKRESTWLRDEYGFLHDRFIFGGAAIGLSLLIAIAVLIGYQGTRSACAEKASALGVPYQYGWDEGCLVKWQGRMVPIGSVRFSENTEEKP